LRFTKKVVGNTYSTTEIVLVINFIKLENQMGERETARKPRRERVPKRIARRSTERERERFTK